MVDLGTLGNVDAPDSWASAINNSGQVVGSSPAFGDTALHAFSWTQAGGMVDLGTLGGRRSVPYEINDRGQVVGESSDVDGRTASHAFSWTQAGGMVDLGTLGGRISGARAVNESGHVAGFSSMTGDSTGDDAATHATLWTQDLIPPTVDISSGPSGLTNDNTPTFTFTTSSGASLSCSIDQGTESFGSCSAAATHSAPSELADGAYVFRVKATNPDGDVVATREFTIDTTAPETTLVSQPRRTTTRRAASFGFTSLDDGAAFECSLDGADYLDCTSPKRYTGLSRRTHEFQVRAIDTAGNRDITPESWTWRIKRR